MVAALYVAAGGCYYGLPDVEPWGLPERDAREYAGPHPVVAHPPCQRWGNFWWAARHLGFGLGDDDGCFGAALAAVREWGGVLEHPKGSRAWLRFDLQEPVAGAWRQSLLRPGEWVTEVAQINYGHRALKWTWLLYVGTGAPPPLNWAPPPEPSVWISTDRPRAELAARGIELMGKRECAATPLPFRDLLLSIARGARLAVVVTSQPSPSRHPGGAR